MYESLIEIDLLKEQNHKQVAPPSRQQVAQTLQQVESKIQEAEALLLVIDTSARELNRPMDVVLDLSNSLLPQVDPDSPLAKDLATIVEQLKRINKIIEVYFLPKG